MTGLMNTPRKKPQSPAYQIMTGIIPIDINLKMEVENVFIARHGFLTIRE